MRDWEALSAPWLRHETRMEAAHAPVLAALIDAASLQPGDRVLDIGIGSGSSTMAIADAIGPDGHVTGVDVAPPFVARASSRLPDTARTIVADAEHAAFEGRPFDAIVSMFGTMFFADTAAAFANLRRAARPGASLSLSAWHFPAENPWLSAAARVTAEVLGPPPTPPDPSGPGPFRFADASVAVAALEEAGWTDVTVDTRRFALTPTGDPAEIAATQMDLGVAAIRMRDEGVREHHKAQIAKLVEQAFAAFQDDDGAVRVPASNHIIRAVNPG